MVSRVHYFILFHPCKHKLILCKCIYICTYHECFVFVNIVLKIYEYQIVDIQSMSINWFWHVQYVKMYQSLLTPYGWHCWCFFSYKYWLFWVFFFSCETHRVYINIDFLGPCSIPNTTIFKFYHHISCFIQTQVLTSLCSTCISDSFM